MKAAMEPSSARRSERVLLLAPFGKDAVHLQKILCAQKVENVICDDVETLERNLNVAAAIITTEEVLSSPQGAKFKKALVGQPSWSNIPIIAFYAAASVNDAHEMKANHPFRDIAEITFIQRPVTAAMIVNAVVSALKDRSRQYQIRDLLMRLEKEIAQKDKYEAELVQAKRFAERAKLRAEDANSSKSQFLANMSHEIRTPLGAIMGFLELLKENANSPAEIENYISVISRNSIHLLRLIDDILDLSKVEAGQMPIEEIELSLADVITDIASLMGFKAREKGIFFSLKIRDDLPARVISDPTRLRQILTNVLGNAIKFTAHGQVELTVSLTGSELKFVVTDTGMGISQESQTRLFKAFSQADDSTTRQFGGTGLGLVLTRHLAEAMGGSFVLERSDVGEGSVFVVKVLIRVPENVSLFNQNTMTASIIDKAAEHLDVLNGLRILVVEDSPDNQVLFAIMLSKFGAKVDIASDGVKGVQRALNGKYDIVLMDVQMPEMDGHGATRVLRAKGFQTPIIALTAHAMQEEREHAIESGFTDFLSKPVQKNELVSMILNHAAR